MDVVGTLHLACLMNDDYDYTFCNGQINYLTQNTCINIMSIYFELYCVILSFDEGYHFLRRRCTSSHYMVSLEMGYLENTLLSPSYGRIFVWAAVL